MADPTIFFNSTDLLDFTDLMILVYLLPLQLFASFIEPSTTTMTKFITNGQFFKMKQQDQKVFMSAFLIDPAYAEKFVIQQQE